MPAEFPLTKGYIAVVDDCDVDLAFPKWQAEPSCSGLVYAARKQYFGPRGLKKTVKLHRVIFERVIGRPLLTLELVDHVNNNPLDCTRENLRLATTSQNIANARRRSDNRSGFKGVHFDKARGLWRAEIKVRGTRLRLGRFNSPEEAHKAYCDAAVEHFGEFANFGGR